jgi:hypothetical protein
MNPAASLGAHIHRFLSASFLNKSQLARDSSLFVSMAILETSRLTLRPFRQDDVDLLSALMANQDFMRFSLGVYTREQRLGSSKRFWRGRATDCRHNLQSKLNRTGLCSAIAVSFTRWSTKKMKSKSVIDCIPTIGTKELQLKQQRLSAITLSEI